VVVVILVGAVVVNVGLDVMIMVGVMEILGDGKCVSFVGINVNEDVGIEVIALVEIIVGLIVIVGVGRVEVTLVGIIVDLKVGVVVVKNVGLWVVVMVVKVVGVDVMLGEGTCVSDVGVVVMLVLRDVDTCVVVSRVGLIVVMGVGVVVVTNDETIVDILVGEIVVNVVGL
jgi:hypothetical protein